MVGVDGSSPFAPTKICTGRFDQIGLNKSVGREIKLAPGLSTFRPFPDRVGLSLLRSGTGRRLVEGERLTCNARQEGFRRQALASADLVEQHMLNRYNAGQVAYADIVTT